MSNMKSFSKYIHIKIFFRFCSGTVLDLSLHEDKRSVVSMKLKHTHHYAKWHSQHAEMKWVFYRAILTICILSEFPSVIPPSHSIWDTVLNVFICDISKFKWSIPLTIPNNKHFNSQSLVFQTLEKDIQLKAALNSGHSFIIWLSNWKICSTLMSGAPFTNRF